MDASAFEISASGMRAQRLRMDLIANNMANAGTTSARRETMRTPDGQTFVRHIPYSRKTAVFMALPGGGVAVPRVVDDPAPFPSEHDPDHPHAVPAGPDAGLVFSPNVNSVIEMVDMMSASRAYEANISALDAMKSMQASALRILA